MLHPAKAAAASGPSCCHCTKHRRDSKEARARNGNGCLQWRARQLLSLGTAGKSVDRAVGIAGCVECGLVVARGHQAGITSPTFSRPRPVRLFISS